jgi:hypothetical protein
MEISPPQKEIISVIQNLKNNKAPGKDGIHSELLKKRRTRTDKENSSACR